MSNININLTAEVDDTPVRGNAMASGDDAFDKKVEDKILRALRDGDVWAWALVTVTATDDATGEEFKTCLGAVSYPSERAFRASETYADMKAEAVDGLEEILDEINNA